MVSIFHILIELSQMMFFIIATGTYALSFGLPTTIHLLGYTKANAQLLTVPVYFFGCMVCVFNATMSDRTKLRSPFILIPYFTGLIGIIICLTISPKDRPGVIYLAMFFVCAGLFPCTPCIVAWLSNNLAGQWKRAVGMALEFTLGNLIGGCIGSNVFFEREAPFYYTGYRIEVSFYSAGVLLACLQAFLLIRENRKRNGIIQGLSDLERARLDKDKKDLGDKNPLFKYTL